MDLGMLPSLDVSDERLAEEREILAEEMRYCGKMLTECGPGQEYTRGMWKRLLGETARRLSRVDAEIMRRDNARPENYGWC